MSTILDDFKKLSDESLIPIYVPSIGREVNFKILNVEQQAEIVRTSAQSPYLAGLYFARAINNIILNNCAEDNVKLTVLDRTAIIYSLRQQAFDEEDKTERIEFIDISSVKDGLIEVDLHIPTIEEDNSFFNYKINEIEQDTDDIKLDEYISGLFIEEIAKFINRIKIGEREALFETYDDESIKNRIDTVKVFPLKLNNKILAEIGKIRRQELSCLPEKVKFEPSLFIQ